MAGPLIGVSITQKSDTTRRWDLLTCWRNERMPERLQCSIGEQTEEPGGANKYPMITLSDFIRGIANGEKFFVDVRVDKPALMAWLQSAPAERHQQAPQASDAPF